MMKINTLKNGYALIVIGYGETSPMENHKGMEVAADDENRRFYVYEIMLACYGLESVTKACEAYPIPA